LGVWEYIQNLLGRKTGAQKVSLAPNLAEASIQFGDRVRILPDASTEARGLVGKVGTVYGQTTPSAIHPDVIGTPLKDYAVSVFIEDVQDQFWFAEQLLEFVDHGAGSLARLDGVDKEWVRNTDGSWDERPRGM
jgi:hypothetical protein